MVYPDWLGTLNMGHSPDKQENSPAQSEGVPAQPEGWKREEKRDKKEVDFTPKKET